MGRGLVRGSSSGRNVNRPAGIPNQASSRCGGAAATVPSTSRNAGLRIATANFPGPETASLASACLGRSSPGLFDPLALCSERRSVGQPQRLTPTRPNKPAVRGSLCAVMRRGRRSSPRASGGSGSPQETNRSSSRTFHCPLKPINPRGESALIGLGARLAPPASTPGLGARRTHQPDTDGGVAVELPARPACASRADPSLDSPVREPVVNGATVPGGTVIGRRYSLRRATDSATVAGAGRRSRERPRRGRPRMPANPVRQLRFEPQCCSVHVCHSAF